MSDDELQITTADMLEIVSGGGNGVEYVDVCGLIETAAKELRQKDAEITRLRVENERLREALKPFADEFSLYKTDFPDHFYISDLGFTFGQLRAARAALEGVTEKSGAGNE